MASPVDHNAIVRVLAATLPGALTVTRAESLSGGASAETCAVDVTDGNGTAYGLSVPTTDMAKNWVGHRCVPFFTI